MAQLRIATAYVIMPPCGAEPMNAIEVEGLTKRFGDFCAVDQVNFSVAPRGGVRPPRAQRRRQVHPDPDADDPGAAHRRRGAGRTATTWPREPDAVRRADRRHPPGHDLRPRPDGGGEPPDLRQALQHSAGGIRAVHR